MKLTNNFDLSEFHCKCGSLVPDEFLDNVKELAENLQVLRDELNSPITINSGYRTPEHNKKIGGVKNSFHLKAMAADIHVKGHTPTEVKKAIEKLIKEGKMKDGGIGLYSTWIHYDTGPKRRW